MEKTLEENSVKNSLDYLVNRFSENLSKYDVRNLFESLKENKGSLAAATKEIDIERKTVYDWESNSSEVKLATKKKMLSACLNDDLIKTVAYLMEKSMLDYSDVAERYSNVIFERIMATEKKSELQDLVHLFENNLKNNKVLIQGANEEKIQAMVEMVNHKAKEFELSQIATDLSLISTDKLANKFLLLIDIFSEKKLRKQDIAGALNLPTAFVDKACEVFGYLDPGEVLNLKGRMEINPIQREISQEKYDLTYRKIPKTVGYIASREY
jgi:DNA-binding XRE family transcriptional regulator